MSKRPSKGEKELLHRITVLEARWLKEHQEAQQSRGQANLTLAVVSELKDALYVLRSDKPVRAKKGGKCEAQSTGNQKATGE